MGTEETHRRWHMGTWCWSTAWAIAWIWNISFSQEKDKKTDTHAEVLQLHRLQAFYFVFIMKNSNTWTRSDWTWDWNCTPLHALCYSWLEKCLFFLKKIKRNCYLYYHYLFLSLHLANRKSQHTGSQLHRVDCTCLILSKIPGNGNCSAQPSALLSRSIWIFSSLSYELGTF